jgi:hypothetical protein
MGFLVAADTPERPTGKMNKSMGRGTGEGGRGRGGAYR